MSRYTLSSSKKEDRPWKIHPVWRGIGCVWLTLLPVMSYAAAWITVREIIFKQRIPILTDYITREMYTRVILPGFQIDRFFIDLNILIRWLPGQPLYYADVLFWFAFLFFGFGISSIIYAFLYRAFGPPKSPFEAMEMRHRRGPY